MTSHVTLWESIFHINHIKRDMLKALKDIKICRDNLFDMNLTVWFSHI